MFKFIEVTGIGAHSCTHVIMISHIRELFTDDEGTTWINLGESYTKCKETIPEIMTLIKETINAN